MKLTKPGVPLTPSRRAPRPPPLRKPTLEMGDLVVIAAKHRIRVEPKVACGANFRYPWPLAHAGSPVLMEKHPAGLRELYGVDNPQDVEQACRWAQQKLAEGDTL